MADPVEAVSDRRDPSGRRLGWVGLGVFAGSFLVALVAASSLGLAWAGIRGLDQAEAKKDLGFAVLGSIGLWVGFVGLPVLWAFLIGGPGEVLGLRARWIDVPLGLAVGAAATIATGAASALLLTAGQQNALESKAETTVDRAHGPAAVVLLFLVLCVATPIAEEVFFRGLLFRALHRVAGLFIALPLAGLVFGLVHYDGEPSPGLVIAVQLALLAFFGMALCALAHGTGRLAAGMVAHGVFNAVTVITLLWGR